VCSLLLMLQLLCGMIGTLDANEVHAERKHAGMAQTQPERSLRSRREDSTSQKRKLGESKKAGQKSPKRQKQQGQKNAAGTQSDNEQSWKVEGKVDVIPVSRKSSRALKVGQQGTLCEPQIKRRPRLKVEPNAVAPKIAAEPGKRDPYTWASGRPVGFTCYKDWITEVCVCSQRCIFPFQNQYRLLGLDVRNSDFRHWLQESTTPPSS
jgi:hypothetical protein